MASKVKVYLASEGLGIKNDKFSRRMLRGLIQNSVPGDTGIFVMTSYLKVGFYDGTLRNPNFVPAKRLDAHLFASAPYVIRGGHAHTPWTPSREAL